MSRRWLVTGGAHGVGRELVLGLARRGDQVVSCGTSAALDGVEPDVAGRIHLVDADVSSETDVEHLFDRALDHLGGIDGVVNAETVGCDSRLAETTLDQWNAALATNVRGPFLVMRRAVEEFLADGGGAITNVVSNEAGQGAFAASQSALLSMTRSVAKEYGPRNVRCNAVVPGARSEDLVDAVTFLVSADASFVTGDTLRLAR